MVNADVPSSPPITGTCRNGRHRLCGGYRCTCMCHGPDHDPEPKLTWDAAIRSIFGNCIGHEHEQVGRCVYCKTCGRRLYQGTKFTSDELAELKQALAEAAPSPGKEA